MFISYLQTPKYVNFEGLVIRLGYGVCEEMKKKKKKKK